MYHCKKCEKELPETEFSAGLLRRSLAYHVCRNCKNGMTKEYQRKNRDKIAEHNRKYQRKNREKYNAKVGLNQIVAKERIIKTACVVCGNNKVVAHHFSYEKVNRTNVIWVCQLHHKKIHEGKIDVKQLPTTYSIPKKSHNLHKQTVLAKIRNNCITELEKSIVEFIVSTNLPVVEIVKLNRRDIDLVTNLVTCNDVLSSVLKISDDCKIHLMEYLRSRKDKEEALFVTQRKPHRMTTDIVHYIMRRIRNRNDVLPELDKENRK